MRKRICDVMVMILCLIVGCLSIGCEGNIGDKIKSEESQVNDGENDIANIKDSLGLGTDANVDDVPGLEGDPDELIVKNYDEYYEIIDHEMCRYLDGCCQTESYPMATCKDDAADHRAAKARDRNPIAQAILDYIWKDHEGVRRGDVRECVKRYRREVLNQCTFTLSDGEEREEDLENICGDLFKRVPDGSIAIGESCEAKRECAGATDGTVDCDNRNSEDSKKKGRICVVKVTVGLGDTCGETDNFREKTCPVNSDCDCQNCPIISGNGTPDFRCVADPAPAALGESCNSVGCASGLFCADGEPRLCQALGNVGDTCAYNNQCKEAFYCADSTKQCSEKLDL